MSLPVNHFGARSLHPELHACMDFRLIFAIGDSSLVKTAQYNIIIAQPYVVVTGLLVNNTIRDHNIYYYTLHYYQLFTQ